MKRIIHYVASVLMIFSFLAQSSFAAVTINNKTLEQIDDIVLETTGTRNIHFRSFLRFMRDKDDNLKFYTTHTVSGDGTITHEKAISVPGSSWHVYPGFHPTAGKKRAEDGSFIVMYPCGDGTEIRFGRVKPKSDSSELTFSAIDWVASIGDELGSNKYHITDMTAGLFPDDNNGREIFIAAGYSPGDKDNAYSKMVFFDPENKRFQVFDTGHMRSWHPSFRVVAGDFDNDGKKNEFAYIRASSSTKGNFWHEYDEYYVKIFRASHSSDGVININCIYEQNPGYRDVAGSSVDGCDITAGDFNGDGKYEIAAVYADQKEDSLHDAFPSVSTYRWTGSGFNHVKSTIDDEEQMLSSSSPLKAGNINHYGIITEAADLDNDGKDELVFLTAGYGYKSDGGAIQVSVWTADNDNIEASRKFWKGTGKNIAGEFTNNNYNHLLHSVSLAIIPVGDFTDGRPVPRLFFSICNGDGADEDHDGVLGDRTWYMIPKLESGKVTDFGDPVDYLLTNEGRSMKLVDGDFYDENLEMEANPKHMVFLKEESYLAEIQAPPYHVDYVPYPVFSEAPTTKAVVNMTYMGSNVVYNNTNIDTEQNDTKFSTTSALEWGVSGGGNIDGVGISGGYKSTTTSIKTHSDMYQVVTNTSITHTADAADTVVYYTTDRHVWRYHVMNAKRPAGIGLDEDCFMTFSMFDTPNLITCDSHTSSQFDNYNPIHEEGNLFSYSTTINHIPYYGAKQRDLSNIIAKTVGGATGNDEIFDLSLTQANNSVGGFTTISKKERNGSISMKPKIPKIMTEGGFEGNRKYSNEQTNTETFTKTYQTTERFKITLKNSAMPFNTYNITHAITAQVYADAAGAMKTAFAVDLHDSTIVSDAWKVNGMYGTRPDPALVLPGKFVRKIDIDPLSKVARTIWIANDNMPSATQLRGIWFTDKGTDKLASSSLVKGKTYTIQIPLYNASFMDTGNFDVEMRLRSLTNGEIGDEIAGISLTQTASLGGWQRESENNKANVVFEWTVPENLSAGNYDLYFVIDPENRLDELHEEWNQTNDPGGNNTGHFPIAILDKEPETYTMAGNVMASSATEGDFRIYFKPIRTDDTRTELTFDEFRKELENKTEDFRAYARVVYSGSDVLTNLYLNAGRIASKDHEIYISSKIIPAIFPNSEYNVSFVVSPERIKIGPLHVSLRGDSVNLQWTTKDSGYDDNDNTTYHSSGGGCNTGINACMLITMIVFYVSFKKK